MQEDERPWRNHIGREVTFVHRAARNIELFEFHCFQIFYTNFSSVAIIVSTVFRGRGGVVCYNLRFLQPVEDQDSGKAIMYDFYQPFHI